MSQQRALRASVRSRRGDVKPLSSRSNTSHVSSRGISGNGPTKSSSTLSKAASRKDRPSPAERRRESEKLQAENKRLHELLVKQQHMHSKASKEKDALIERLQRDLTAAESKIEQFTSEGNEWKVKYNKLEKNKQEEYKAILTSQMERGKRLEAELSEAENRLNCANKILERNGIDPVTQEKLQCFSEQEDRRRKELEDLDVWIEKMHVSQSADLEAMESVTHAMSAMNDMLRQGIEHVGALTFDDDDDSTPSDGASLPRPVSPTSMTPLAGLDEESPIGSASYTPITCSDSDAVISVVDVAKEEMKGKGHSADAPPREGHQIAKEFEDEDELVISAAAAAAAVEDSTHHHSPLCEPIDTDEDSLNSSAVVLGEEIEIDSEQLHDILDQVNWDE